ncbi:MAG: prolyl oligopeptidase family serine peptidase [Woeseiaceae bacterium]
MTRLTSAAVALLFVALIPSPATAAEWSNPADIPQAEPVTVGPAGERPADIVRYLLADGANAARLSPDGSRVAFEWTVTGEPQLWIVDASGGWPRQVTFGSGITFFRWAPGGGELLIGRDAEGNEREGYYLISADGAHEQRLLPQSDAFRQFGMFSPDGGRIVYSSTERNGLDFDIYIMNVAGGEPRRIVEGSFGYFPSGWQPRGDIVIVSETRGEDANDVHFLNVESGELEGVFQPGIAASYQDFAWLPDGTGFYLSTNQDREFAGLAFYSLEDKQLEFIETPEFDVANVSISGDGRFLVWTVNEDGYSRLHALDRSSGETLDVPSLPDGVYTLHFARHAPVLSMLVTGSRTPGDVWTWDLEAATEAHAVKSSLGGLGAADFVAPVSLGFAARDGVELHGLLYLPDPARFEGKPPVVVDVHGGPTSQARPDFAPATQYLVNNGIAVFDVNVRGSTGFGKTFTRLDNQERRLDSVRDLADTVAFLNRDGRVDTSRTAVMGGSYGGYMVNAVLGSYPGAFDAGVSAVGVSDWVRALQGASPGLRASDRIEYGDIREQRWLDFYAQNSPINNAAKITVPLLVEHGANDPRDPVTESDRLVTTIREAGGTVEYLRFPDEGHSLAKRSNQVIFYRRMADFLNRHLEPDASDVAD